MKERWLITILIPLILVFSGCQQNAGYFDRNPDVLTIAENELANEAAASRYIVMKRTYMEQMQALKAAHDEAGFKDETINRSAQIAEKVFYELLFDETDTYLRLDEDGQYHDYLKELIAFAVVKSRFPETMQSIEEAAETYTEGLLQSQLNQVHGKLMVNEFELVQITADHLGMTYEDCLLSVYKNFYILNETKEMHRMYYLGSIYEGEKIEYDGSNDEAYAQYFRDVYAGYDAYINHLVHEFERKYQITN